MVIKFSKQQFETFESDAADRWDRETGQSLLDLYPSHMASLGVSPDQAVAFVRTVREYALPYQVTTKRDTYKLVIIAMSLGAHFPHDPRFAQAVSATLGQLSIPQDRRLILLADHVANHLQECWSGKGLGAIGGELVACLQPALTPEETLDRLASRHPGIVRSVARQAMLTACLAQADGYGLQDPQHRTAYLGAAAIHGVYWFDNPLMARLRQIVEDTENIDDLCQKLAQFYEGFA
ncbi:hypothetical protein So717_26490 [Roseobacter cerasinus]|uniref:Uncharacterized protein n=1 Tax=Roseobacter cerasinus TaxID=2602289 RepID=A0A640VXF3_9RHOB|nr:hypothetical protein [Roseobacter cerasinus]GFE50896.1 hypothetical protein So717_26490 [Roseobacter cerasinus]